MSVGRTALELLGVDVGTTHCKAAVYDPAGRCTALASGPTPVRQDTGGRPFIGPDALWACVASLITKAADGMQLGIVGVAGMAEAGLLVDRATGIPRSEIIPWYDSRSSVQADRMEMMEPAKTGFRRSGLHPSFKYGLAKILWLRDRDETALEGSVWLSVPDYIVYRLTGHMVTDPSLAARTYAYCVPGSQWDQAWIERLGLAPSMFPPVLPSGVPVGGADGVGAAECGLASGTPVAVSGHDHICALAGVGITNSGPVLDSMGTAESLMGVMPRWDDRAYDSGLTEAPCVLPGRYCWLGGLPASGGSIEWLRAQLGERPVPYLELERLAADAGPEPTGIIYFPYLSGSGAPRHDQNVRAAFLGLSARHGRGDLIRAVMEGTAYQSLSILYAARDLTGVDASEVLAVGGGTRSREWLQIKADVSGKRHLVPEDEEAAVRGAAFTAALGAGLLDLDSLPMAGGVTAFDPDAERHARYLEHFETEFVPFQRPLRTLDASGTAATSLAHA